MRNDYRGYGDRAPAAGRDENVEFIKSDINPAAGALIPEHFRAPGGS